MPKQAAQKPTDPSSITRTMAADIIEQVRTMVAKRRSPMTIERILKEKFGVEPLQKCEGDAHSNPHADSCAVCDPRWGYTGPRLKVR